MNGSVDRLLEAIRQRALVRSGRLYRQVECISHTRGCLEYGLDCFSCGAQV